jgi:hypothetical protein
VRDFSFLLCVLTLTISVGATAPVTVAQVEQFLTSARASKLSDDEIADRLSKVTLSEQLTVTTLARIHTETDLGPDTEEQLELLGASSLLLAPPKAELPNVPAPDSSAQKQITDRARDYARRALHLLPDFLAERETRAFDNVPVRVNKSKHAKAKIQVHFVRESRREIAFRNGREVNRAIAGTGKSQDVEIASGLSSWGEFGAILTVVLGDATDESLEWSRWQTSDSGAQVAVFRYAIPRSSSHYTVDFCCYRKSDDDPIEYPFNDKPGYHGQIYVDPASGEIDRITLEAELLETDPVMRSALAVQYGQVAIDAKRYLCPIWSVAVSELHSAAIEKIDGIGIERHVNKVEFGHYHKFGSTARILTGAAAGP